MSKSFEALKAELLKFKEQKEIQKIIINLDTRKKAIKEEIKLHKKLTAAVKKAGKQSPGSLDFNSPENMYHSEKDTARYLEGTSYMDAFEASKLDQEWN
jgi:hypothetical protein|tara:strand:+ start:184 stop:480 length:297 start_codon:yes stop_codon:yes gene_type:complete